MVSSFTLSDSSPFFSAAYNTLFVTVLVAPVTTTVYSLVVLMLFESMVTFAAPLVIVPVTLLFVMLDVLPFVPTCTSERLLLFMLLG